MEEKLAKEIGNRLRFIRNIYHEGSRLSSNQFAHLFNESLHRILSYEQGRSNIPVYLIYQLYYRGINPIFLITGEHSIFAPNKAGYELYERIKGKVPSSVLTEFNIPETALQPPPSKPDVEALKNPLDFDLDELIQQAEFYAAAAGDLMKYIKAKQDEKKQWKK
ncbi:MAG: hypothetical protein ACUVQ1_04905 [Candidatus Kapaibacteriales bacterium]